MYGPTIDGLEFANIEEDRRLSLEMDFSKEVAAKVLQEMEVDKTPSLDGFTMAFFGKCWSVVENDVMAFFWSFS